MNKKDSWRPVVSNEEWREIEKKLSVLHPIRMMIDGYRVKITMIRHEMKIVIVPIINSEYNIEKWERDAEIPHKFFPETEKWLYPKKTREKVIKSWGKKEAEKKGLLDKYKTIRYYWTSYGAMKRHYIKTCRNIQVCKADIEHTTLLGIIGEAYHV